MPDPTSDTPRGADPLPRAPEGAPLDPPSVGHWTARLRPPRPEHSSLRVFGIILAGAALATLAVAMVAPSFRHADADLDPPAALALVTDAEGRPEAIAATGFAPETLERLRREPPSVEDWSRRFPVESDGSPVKGSWEAGADRVVFYPDRPFRRATYVAHWTDGPSRELVVETPGAASPTSVVAVHPTTDMIPANLAALEIELSGPMGEGDPLEHLTLIEEDRRPLSLRDAGIEPIWNEERTRLLVPLVARAENGEAKTLLAPGRRYRLLVERSWRDAEGRLIAPPEERLFLSRASDREAPAFAELDLTPPGSEQAPVTLDFPEPLSRRSLDGALRVVDLDSGKPVEGSIRLSNGGTRWTFVPKRPWQPRSAYAVQLRGEVSDLAGNRLETTGGAGGVLPFRLEPSAATT
ncbi:MAG TPA: Ig-like domain-containing protein [Thermoanaerobaculia bacterium]|nr:Ig-like domain-containing protein [Thermoanaerobaculia bacterium]